MPRRHPPAWHTTVSRRPAPGATDVDVEVRVSPRRRKSSVAYWQGDTIVVVLPAGVPAARRDAVVDDLVERVLTYRPNASASDDELTTRAGALADRYVDGVRPGSIRWVTNQNTRWGSCTPGRREIRISHRLRAAPSWVLDAVVVHELAHLLELGHGPRFRAIINRFERMADADLFLAGYALGLGQVGSGPGAGEDDAAPACIDQEAAAPPSDTTTRRPGAAPRSGVAPPLPSARAVQVGLPLELP